MNSKKILFSFIFVFLISLYAISANAESLSKPTEKVIDSLNIKNRYCYDLSQNPANIVNDLEIYLKSNFSLKEKEQYSLIIQNKVFPKYNGTVCNISEYISAILENTGINQSKFTISDLAEDVNKTLHNVTKSKDETIIPLESSSNKISQTASRTSSISSLSNYIMDTAPYLHGKTYAVLIFVDTPSNTWNQGDIDYALEKMGEMRSWLVDWAPSQADVSFNYGYYKTSISTGYNPSQCANYYCQCWSWMNAAMNNLGFYDENSNDLAIDEFNNYLLQVTNSKNVYPIFMIKNWEFSLATNDRSYSCSLNDIPRITMYYYSGCSLGLCIREDKDTYIHESLHSFGAADEYSGGYACKSASDCNLQIAWGYLNGNCDYCSGTTNSIMKGSHLSPVIEYLNPSYYTQGQIGWGDHDSDRILDPTDNCPLNYNTNQANNEGDAQGDVCDYDDDNDGVLDSYDNCMYVYNPSQENTDGDNMGNACDSDDDNDGVLDVNDVCVNIYGTYCHGCSIPPCQPGYSPSCPSSGQPTCIRNISCVKPDSIPYGTIYESVIFCPGTYNVSGLILGNNNIVILCNQTILRGDYNSGSTAIYSRKEKNLTIQNCQIESYSYGIDLTYSNNSKIINNTLKNIKWGGLNIYDSTSVNILNNYIINSTNPITIGGCLNCNISNNFIKGYGGMMLSLVNNSDISSNIIITDKNMSLYADNRGIRSLEFYNNLFSYNTLNGSNSSTGFELFGTNNDIRYNRINNYETGVYIIGKNNFLRSNVFYNNAYYGLIAYTEFPYSSNNIIVSNLFYTTGVYDRNLSANTYCVNDTGNNYYNGATGPTCPKCYKNSDCNDTNPYTCDVCINPGQINSMCSYTSPICSSDLDCGKNILIGNKICINNSVSQNYTSYKCNNPGSCTNSFCSNSITPLILQQCSLNQICQNGNCTCVTNITNSSWSSWQNISCLSNGKMNQSRFLIQYDSNNCGEISNKTLYEYQLVGPTYINTTASNWNNISCLINDKMNQTRSFIQYDIYSCVANKTIIQYQTNLSCDFCKPNITNTTPTEWKNQTTCLSGDYYIQNRSKIEYDANSCYLITNLPSDLWNNKTYLEFQNQSCNYCNPNLVYTSWNNWQNISSCTIRNSIYQNWSRIVYDSNKCKYDNGTFKFVNKTEYEVRELNDSCDYCSYNIQFSNWSEYFEQESCKIDDSQIKMRTRTQFDSNYNNCYAITHLTSDLWNNGKNLTINESKPFYCNYCSANITGPFYTNLSECDRATFKESNQKYYLDENYERCCKVTGLESDCQINLDSYYFNETISTTCNRSFIIRSPYNGKSYDIQSLNFSVLANESLQRIDYIDYFTKSLSPRWNLLASNKKEYSRIKNFAEGNHTLVATGTLNNTIYWDNVSFFIDSFDPKINNVYPAKNSFVNNNAYLSVLFEDKNPSWVDLYVNNNKLMGKNTNNMEGSQLISFGGFFENYNGQSIEYYFIVKDVAGNTKKSKPVKIFVDTTSPEIKSLKYNIRRGNIAFNISIFEMNLDRVVYIENGYKEQILCTRLNKNGECIAKKSFTIGNHNINVIVRDKAGNSVEKSINFSV